MFGRDETDGPEDDLDEDDGLLDELTDLVVEEPVPLAARADADQEVELGFTWHEVQVRAAMWVSLRRRQHVIRRLAIDLRDPWNEPLHVSRSRELIRLARGAALLELEERFRMRAAPGPIPERDQRLLEALGRPAKEPRPSQRSEHLIGFALVVAVQMALPETAFPRTPRAVTPRLEKTIFGLVPDGTVRGRVKRCQELGILDDYVLTDKGESLALAAELITDTEQLPLGESREPVRVGAYYLTETGQRLFVPPAPRSARHAGPRS